MRAAKWLCRLSVPSSNGGGRLGAFDLRPQAQPAHLSVLVDVRGALAARRKPLVRLGNAAWRVPHIAHLVPLVPLLERDVQRSGTNDYNGLVEKWH